MARLGEIGFTNMISKTWSGKIIHLLLHNLAASEEIAGDISTLEECTVLDKLLG